MFGKYFVLNEQTLSIMEEMGKQMPGGFFIYKADETEEILFANSVVVEMFGCKDIDEFREFTGNSFRGMLHPDDYPSIEASIVEQIKRNEDKLDYVEYRIIRKDGEIRWVEDYGHYTETDAYNGVFYVFISDITTARQEAAAKLKQLELEQRLQLQEKLLEEERQRAQQEKMITALASDYWSVYYVELDKDDCICYQPHPALKDGAKQGEHFSFIKQFAKYAEENIVESYRQQFLDFIQPQSLREKLLDRRVISFTYLTNRNGVEAYEMIKFAGVRHPEDRDDNIVHAVGACITDVDSETRANLERNEALSLALNVANEASKAKTTFLSNMSHEIRTPLNAVIGLDAMALNDPNVKETTKDYLRKIASSAEHLLDLINDILDMSRIESGRMSLRNEEFAFHKLINSINAIFSSQCKDKGLEYQCSIVGKVNDYYIGDNMKLRQVLINILGNAVKFTPKGGKISFNVKRVTRYENKSTLQFTISDNGIGINKEFLPHIYDAFAQEDSSFSNKYGSSGLGMAITKGIIDMMNGNITVISEKGCGTTFVVTVTLVDSNRKIEDDLVLEIKPNDLSILIIDNDIIDGEHARMAFEKEGIAADFCKSGEEAIDLVKLHNARSNAYNLILADYQMPGMDGIETSRKIRELVGQNPVILILTAYRWDNVIQEAKEAGVDDFISKPLSIPVLLDEYKEIIKRREFNRQRVNLEGKRVLLAEDVEVNAEIICMILASKKIEVEVATNGKIATEMFEQHDKNYYDLILMDMRMPEMDGLEATRYIRNLPREDAKTIPIIALTANAFDEDVQRSLQAGLNAHLTKPVQPDIIFETLQKLIK